MLFRSHVPTKFRKSSSLADELPETLSSPDETWGFFRNEVPVIVYMKKFSDIETGAAYFTSVEVVNGITGAIREVANPVSLRHGVPLSIVEVN